jgi:hypothetical protein
VLCLYSAPEFSLSVLYEALTQNLKAVVEVFERKHNARPTSQGLHLSAPVAKFGKERLDEAKFAHYVKVAIGVNLLVQG